MTLSCFSHVLHRARLVHLVHLVSTERMEMLVTLETQVQLDPLETLWVWPPYTTIHTYNYSYNYYHFFSHHYLFIPLFIYVTIYLLSIYHYLLQHFIYTTIYMLIWKGPQGIQGPPGEIGPPGPPVSVQLPRSAENKPFVSQLVGYLFPLLRVQLERRESQVERDRGYVSTKHDCIVELKWLPSLIFPLGSTGTAWVSRTTRCHWITCKQLLIWPWQWNFNQSDNSI